jgi:sugar/nucleoside kinase (ribokinase family)
MHVCTIGDLVLDVVVRLDQPLAAGADANARSALTAGGQAANVAAWAATLGARARFVGKIGDDDAGRFARQRLEQLGVEVVGPVEPRGNGIIVSLVSPEGERTMCSDRGVAPYLRPDELDERWFRDCDVLHVAGYSLLRDPIRAAARHAIGLARDNRSRVSVDLSSWSAIRDFGPERFRQELVDLAPDVVFCNEDEERILGGRLDGPVWILKRGREGCSFGGEQRPAHPVGEVVDSTGAGDALAAGWLVGGPELALDAAARCVAQVGAMP